jgi:hypothetical protein
LSERRPKSEAELVGLVRSLDVRAPQRLHATVEALVAGRAAERARRAARLRWGLAGVATVCAAAVALVLSLSGGGSTLTLRTAVALTLRPATMAAPAQGAHDRMRLATSVDGVAFPYWDETFGWRATGARTDRVDGRAVTTVFYATRRRRWVGYAIVAGRPAPRIAGGVVVWRHGVPYRLQAADGAQAVTWLRDGRLCVLAGRGVSRQTLLSLASWSGHGKLAA